MKRIDLTGQRFGRLTVIRYDHSEHDGAHWLCKCDCGKEKVAAGYSLRSGNTKSCGCLNSDASRAKLEKAGKKAEKSACGSKEAEKRENRRPQSLPNKNRRRVFPFLQSARMQRVRG